MFYMAIENKNDRLKAEKLYTMYRNLMYKEAYGILSDIHLSEDAVSESFIRIINNLHKINENNCPRTRNFLVIICRNVAKDIKKKRTYLNTVDNLTEEISNEEDVSCSNPENIIINAETLEKIAKIIEKLKPIYRDVFILRWVYQLSREKIAYIFGISIEAVKKRLVRAKVKIKKCLEAMEESK